jgi:hypothetical protein
LKSNEIEEIEILLPSASIPQLAATSRKRIKTTLYRTFIKPVKSISIDTYAILKVVVINAKMLV